MSHTDTHGAEAPELLLFYTHEINTIITIIVVIIIIIIITQ